MTNKTTTTINFKDLPKEIKVCLDSVNDDFKTKVQMSDFTKFPDIESFSECKLTKQKSYQTNDKLFFLLHLKNLHYHFQIIHNVFLIQKPHQYYYY